MLHVLPETMKPNVSMWFASITTDMTKPIKQYKKYKWSIQGQNPLVM